MLTHHLSAASLSRGRAAHAMPRWTRRALAWRAAGCEAHLVAVACLRWGAERGMPLGAGVVGMAVSAGELPVGEVADHAKRLLRQLHINGKNAVAGEWAGRRRKPREGHHDLS